MNTLGSAEGTAREQLKSRELEFDRFAGTEALVAAGPPCPLALPTSTGSSRSPPQASPDALKNSSK